MTTQRRDDVDDVAILFSRMRTADFDKITLSLYVVEGLLISLANLFLAIRLFSNRHLRAQKEHVIIGACLLFDVIFGLTYFSGGVFRAIPLVLYDYFPQVSMWYCFSQIHTQLFILTTVMSGIFCFSTAVDRLLCVFRPIFYLKQHLAYAYTLMFLPFLLHFALLLPAGFASYRSGAVKTSTMVCYVREAVTLEFFMTYRIIRIVSSLGCILIYIPIFAKMYRILQKQKKTSVESKRNQQRLLNMTTTVAMITGSTICLFTVPDVIVFFYPFIQPNVIYVVSLQKGVVNLLVFLKTQRFLRNLVLPKSLRETSSVIPSLSKSNQTRVL